MDGRHKGGHDGRIGFEMPDVQACNLWNPFCIEFVENSKA